MNVSDASTIPNEHAKTPESHNRVLRPRKQVRPNYMEPEGNVVRLSRKRCKVPARFRKVRGVFGFLARMLTDVPIEVIYFGIFSYLNSRDLLTLSRTCKLLRSHLLDKTNDVERIWRTARFNIEGNPPPLPKDLNEFQYARLMFGLECHLCLDPSRSNTVLWNFRLKCCRDCLESFCEFDWRILSQELYPFTSSEIIPQERVRSKDRNDITIIDFQVAQRLKAQYMSLEHEEERNTWLTQKRKERKAIAQHARLCEVWHQGQQERRAAQIIELRTGRLNAILSHLEMIGLRQDAQLILDGKSDSMRSCELADLSCFKQPKELTDCGWTRIKPKLIEMLTDHRTKRLAQQSYLVLRDGYYDYLSQQDLREIYPGLGDVLTDPIIEAAIWETGLEEALTPASLQTLLANFLDRFLDNWRIAKREELLRIMRKGRPSATAGDLHLATTIFGCAACNVLLVFPQVFYHCCCYKTRAANNQSHARMRILNKLYDTSDQEGPWSSRSLFLHLQRSQLAQKIVSAACLDPSTATISDLTVAQPVIECTGPQADNFPERLFLTWPTALTYHVTGNEDIPLTINQFGQHTSQIHAKEPLCMFLETICCTRCHMEIPPRGLSHHHHLAHNVQLPSMNAIEFYQLHGSHWYWNPREGLHSIGTDFRW
ncbi:hypothetical protein EV361DRAFT_955644 [Lentinula raphanica]|nr:hypothetical protein EV361DRAFT_955644 [Lentinula raphanica]